MAIKHILEVDFMYKNLTISNLIFSNEMKNAESAFRIKDTSCSIHNNAWYATMMYNKQHTWHPLNEKHCLQAELFGTLINEKENQVVLSQERASS